jgi:RNA polymerase sigma factor (sigma-70 family)
LPLLKLDDQRLAARVRGGDDAAFAALYERHHAALLAFCRHMLGNREDGEDAVQQTFLRAHRALAAGKVPDAVRSWLFAIARNRCLTLIAARRSAAVPVEEVEVSFDGLADEVRARADLRQLVADLGRLPQDQRAALVLSELGDWSHVEIADALGCAPGKVKALVFQARTTLIADRDARETPCDDIRRELSVASGGALRRGPLKRHLRQCDPCRAFQVAVGQQRAGLATILPVAPSAGLMAAVLGGGGGAGASGAGLSGAAGSSGAGAATVATSGAAVATAGGIAVKAVLAKVALTAAVAAGGAVAVEQSAHHAAPPRPAAAVAAAAATPAPAEVGTRVVASRIAGPAATPVPVAVAPSERAAPPEALPPEAAESTEVVARRRRVRRALRRRGRATLETLGAVQTRGVDPATRPRRTRPAGAPAPAAAPGRPVRVRPRRRRPAAPVPTGSATPAPRPRANGLPAPGAVPVPRPRPRPRPRALPAPTVSPDPTATPTPRRQPRRDPPAPTPTPTETSAPTETSTPEPTASPTETPTP